METVQKQRNYSLDVFRFAAAFFVVVCHTEFLIEAPEGVYQFIARFAPRVSVAFFFAISGYYYTKALATKTGVFKKQFCSLLKVYAAWTMIYYAASFVVNVIMEGKDLGTFLLERVVFFITKGSYSHFWYFPALIYSVVLVTLFHKLLGKKGVALLAGLALVLFVFGNLGSSYYTIGLRIPVFKDWITEHRDGYEVFRGIFCMGLPYFSMGYYLNELEPFIRKISQRKLSIIVVITIILYCAEIFLLSNVLKWYEYPEVFVMLYPAALVIMMLLIKNPKPEWKAFAGTLKRLSGYIYYVHPLFILMIGIVFSRLNIVLHSLVLYMIIIGVSVGSGLFLIWLNKKIKWIGIFI